MVHRHLKLTEYSIKNIADLLSRLPQLGHERSLDQDNDIHYTNSKLDFDIVDAAKKIDQNSWEIKDKNIYFPFRLELTTLGLIILRGNRIVMPQTLQKRALELAHEDQPDETTRKRRLRAKVWWPLVDRETERFVKLCRDCLMVTQLNKPPPMIRHKFPEGSWPCLALDLMGLLPNQDKVFVIIDYYSRYQEI
ncbi:hypothetical protein NQ314_014589 [Rhamnusium bicolor]|uniref:RNA-directed DNA polymerase n=1 Tax=Rhamnusium bicolor TaxID=1586634 RepID=A0AAV8X175_9CUCU|nr:hypothetical protein NQ314_014589 [Rhamnusium bicolor]